MVYVGDNEGLVQGSGGRDRKDQIYLRNSFKVKWTGISD